MGEVQSQAPCWPQPWRVCHPRLAKGRQKQGGSVLDSCLPGAGEREEASGFSGRSITACALQTGSAASVHLCQVLEGAGKPVGRKELTKKETPRNISIPVAASGPQPFPSGAV